MNVRKWVLERANESINETIATPKLAKDCIADTFTPAITKLVEALRAWEHWYSEDSTEFNRDSAREMGLKALAEFEEERGDG